jgi:hypothetical protein
VRAELLKTFLGRGWSEAQANEDRHWCKVSAAERLRISDELRRSAARMNPGWPSAAERDADLASHIRVAELLRRVEQNRKR